LLINLPSDGGATGWRFLEITALTNYGDFESYDFIKGSNSDWNSNYGMGTIYTNSQVQPGNVLYRGGSCVSSTGTGIYAMGLSYNVTTSFSGEVGFRCAK